MPKYKIGSTVRFQVSRDGTHAIVLVGRVVDNDGLLYSILSKGGTRYDITKDEIVGPV